jgi:hypothetical protein
MAQKDFKIINEIINPECISQAEKNFARTVERMIKLGRYDHLLKELGLPTFGDS